MDAIFDDDFWTAADRKLRRPDLACLEPDPATYRTLVFQPKGQISYDDSGIWFTKKDEAKAKFSAFIKLGFEKNTELIITPEYSCPWDCLTEAIAANQFPSKRNLWLLGMNSIHPQELIDTIKSLPEINWVYDQELVNESAATQNDHFFDPVCIVLNTDNAAGENQMVVIIQFKNYRFGGADSIWERKNLIVGKTFYVIKNQKNSIRLITLICSDTLKMMDFNEIKDREFSLLPLLIVHIQLNQKPFAPNYKMYRNLLFSKGDKDAPKEVICLNWAAGVTFHGETELEVFNEFSGSAFYLKSTKLAKKDDEVNQNHKKGLYYTFWENKYAHIYYLNYDEFVFEIENTKCSQLQADPSQFNRTGPKVLSALSWKQTAFKPVTGPLSDGFADMVTDVEEQPNSLNCLKGNPNYLDAERMLLLCSGDIKITEDWHSVSKMNSCMIEDNERNNRILFCQLPDAEAHHKRRQKIVNYSILKNGIISQPKNLPAELKGAILKFDEPKKNISGYLLNLHSTDNKVKGTALYLGAVTNAHAIGIQQQVSDLFQDSHQGKRVMVWYESTTGRIRYPVAFATPEILENVNNTSDSITKKREP